MIEPLVKVEGVTKSYGDLQAVAGVSLTISAGEIVGLIGANGAGKSTLIRMIAGIAAPDAGRVLIGGDDLARRSSATKRRIGYLPEELFFYERLTGEEYLQLVAGLKDVEMAQVDGELEFFGLHDVKQKLIGGYSLGMRKKLGLASAMIGGPDVLILDEPLNGLDVEMMRRLRLRIETERDSGRAVLVSSHVMSFVERICDRVAVMRLGCVIAMASVTDLRELTGMKNEPFEDLFFRLVQTA